MMNICSTCQGAQTECQERLDANAEYREHINEHARRRGPALREGPDRQQELPLAARRGHRPRRAALAGQAAAEGPTRRPVLRLLHRPPDRPAGHRRRAPARHVPAQVIEALGGTVIEYAGQHKCCGFPIITMNKEASLKQAGAPPRRRDRRRRRLPRHAVPAVPPEPRPAAAAGRAHGGPRARHAGPAPPPARRPRPRPRARRSSGWQRHVVKPTSVIDWSTSVVAGVRAGSQGCVSADRAPARAPCRSPARESAPCRALPPGSDDRCPRRRRSGDRGGARAR